jgi:hypothetical protein
MNGKAPLGGAFFVRAVAMLEDYRDEPGSLQKLDMNGEAFDRFAPFTPSLFVPVTPQQAVTEPA